MPWQSFDENVLSKIAYKLVDTKTPHLKKLIIKRIPLKKKVRVGPQTIIFLVRDGFIVKACTPNAGRFSNIAHRLGFKKSIRSQNIGALFKKYSIPKSTGKIMMSTPFINMSIHSYARSFRKLVEVFGESVDNANKVLAQSHVRLPYHLKNPVFHDFMGRMSIERKIDVVTAEYFLDMFYSYRTICTESPNTLELIDWRRSAQNLHDDLYKAADRINNPDRCIPIPYNDRLVWAVSNCNNDEEMIANNLTIRLAKDGDELLEWGTHLHHCIGGYTCRALSGAE